MKKLLGIMLAFMMVLSLVTVNVFAEPAIIGELKGSTAATGTWDGDVPKEAEGDSLMMELSGDAYGFVFENLEPGIYKIGYYLNLEFMATGKQIRISPRVTANGANEIRCWIDIPVNDVLTNLEDMDADVDEDGGKVLLVAVITVPEGYNKIDVGAWQDEGAFIGLLDKVVLATGDYVFDADGDYALGAEKGNSVHRDEDPNDLLFAEDDWVDSYEMDEPNEVPVVTDEPTATPEVTPEATPETTIEPTPDATEEATKAPATSAPVTNDDVADDEADDETDNGDGSWIIIVAIVAAVVVVVVIVVVVVKKKKG